MGGKCKRRSGLYPRLFEEVGDIGYFLGEIPNYLILILSSNISKVSEVLFKNK